ncbi:MAG: class B sortase [Clostridia bacterium]|nr:class B sortase [Clostridia bacterium]
MRRKGMTAVAEEKKQKSLFWRILLGVFAAVFLVAVVMLVLHLWPSDDVVVPPSSVSSAPEVILVDNPIDFAALHEKNSDIKAWIRVPGTVIDYPVMQADENTDDVFYLKHDENKQPRRSGSIYIEKVNSGAFTDPHTVLYGHNMANGSMFSAVHKFKKKDFFQEHEYLYVYTPGHILTYRIFSCFMYDDRHLMYAFDYDDKAQYADFLEQALHPVSMTRQVREGVSVTPDDRIITLSTCTNFNADKRLLLEGVLIDDQLTK